MASLFHLRPTPPCRFHDDGMVLCMMTKVMAMLAMTKLHMTTSMVVPMMILVVTKTMMSMMFKADYFHKCLSLWPSTL